MLPQQVPLFVKKWNLSIHPKQIHQEFHRGRIHPVTSPTKILTMMHLVTWCSRISFIINIFLRQPMDGYEYVPHGSTFPNSLGFPVGASVNRLTGRLYNPMDFQNGNKFLARQPLQPFLLQHLLQQQHQQQLAKCKLCFLNCGRTSILPLCIF